MFTGLIQAIGVVAAARPRADGFELEVDLRGLRVPVAVGDSIALSGVCCTVVRVAAEIGLFELSAETLRRTWLGRAQAGWPLNLEAAVRAGEPLGGHLVQGHADGQGEVITPIDARRGGELEVALPPQLQRYCVSKGSIALDGVSLTVASLNSRGVMIAVIPHTAQITTLGRALAGQPVHVEVDVLAKYVERLVAPYAAG